MPSGNEQEIRAFVQHALCAVADIAFDAVVCHLLNQDIHAGNILGGLLRCEWSNIHWLLLNSRDQELSSQVAVFSDCVGHYNNLQGIIIEEAESIWAHSLENEKVSRVLAESKVHWFRQKSVELHNYFQEIPVRAKVELLDTVDDDITVLFTADAGMVFSASDDLKTAYISAGDCMRLTVRGVERYGNQLRLAIVGIESDLMSRRHQVRVAVPKPIPITLRHGKKEHQASICDTSVQGLGVIFSKGMGVKLESTSALRAGDQVQCHWRAGNMNLESPAAIRWIREVKGEYRAGLEIKADNKVKGNLQKFLMEYQRGVIARLRSIVLPEWMEV